MTEALLDEADYRRADFVPGEPVKLADGQVWQLRRPVIVFEAWDESDTGWRSSLSVEGTDDYQSLLDRRTALFKAAQETGTYRLAEAAAVELPIARRLLLANYDLDNSQVNKLLRFVYEEQHPLATVRDDVMEVAVGSGPKRSPDGDDSSDSPSEESDSIQEC
ncbi:hypothetical protein [Singulisphaera sp. PoT]|uniref:hypothetical protein n=1 Tax=Singulisphaera sp. PoT TaxID=3411797 RepID=UPI003BF607D4